MYLDYGIQAAETYEKAYFQGNTQKQDMIKAGRTINLKKIEFFSRTKRFMARF